MIRKRTSARVRHIIAQKVAMKRRWEADPDGMRRRSKAGAKAMSDLGAKHRVWWSNWLYERARRLTKAQLIDGIARTIQDEGRAGMTKPSSMLARLVRYGFVRFDPLTLDYINERSQELGWPFATCPLSNILSNEWVTKRAKLNDLTAPATEAKSFDAWFFAQPKKEQERMRENGVLPYREMVPSKHVFAIDPNNRAWAVSDAPVERTEVDAFISRDHVGVMLRAFIDALACSDSFAFRRHVELIRWALSLPGCLSSRTIGGMYGRSHFWMRSRAREIQMRVNSDACGVFPHVNAKRDKFKQARPRHTPDARWIRPIYPR